MPKILLGISILLMTLSLVFGFLNTNKVKTLRNDLTTTISDRDVATHARTATEKKFRSSEKELTAAKSLVADAAAKVQSTEAQLIQAQTEKAEAEAKIQASEAQIADLQKQVATVAAGGGGAPGGGISPNDAQAALEDTKKQLEAAEQEKSILADKVKAAQDQVTAMQEEKKRRDAGTNTPGVHGTVLAVNQAYNFVVLGIGEHEGVVPNSEMLVLRAGSMIGKIRISSVEPTTSIGDIVTSTLPRGVEVQPGDTVVYAGNTNS
jgi:hypothetical protein